MNDAIRRYYAAHFNTYDACVLFWEEMSDAQQAKASGMFSGVEMDGYAYETTLRDSEIVSRHRLHYSHR